MIMLIPETRMRVLDWMGSELHESCPRKIRWRMVNNWKRQCCLYWARVVIGRR